MVAQGGWNRRCPGDAFLPRGKQKDVIYKKDTVISCVLLVYHIRSNRHIWFSSSGNSWRYENICSTLLPNAMPFALTVKKAHQGVVIPAHTFIGIAIDLLVSLFPDRENSRSKAA